MSEELNKYLNEISVKHSEEDAIKKERGDLLKKELGDDVEKVKTALSQLYQDMIYGRYSDLMGNFDFIKSKLGNSSVRDVSEKIEKIEKGLKDMELNKFNNATKYVRDIKELL